MRSIIPDDLMSWLKCLHIEYVSEAFYREISTLDINNSSDQDMIIERAFVPEFVGCNDISKKSLLGVLEKVATFPESKVREMLWGAGPLTESLKDYKVFFDKVRDRCVTL